MIRIDFFPHQNALTLAQIYELLALPLPEGVDARQTFTTVNTLKDADADSITLLHNKAYAKDAAETKAGLCITNEALAHHVAPGTHVLVHPAPYRAYALITSTMFPKAQTTGHVHPTAVIHETATIGENCQIGPYVVILENAKIGSGSILDSHVHIGSGVVIGAHARIETSVTITHAIIGNNVYIKPGTRIGQPGFGFHMDEKGHFDVPQLGIVEIGNDVQIGSNVCIDRGSLGTTTICDGVRIDNLVQIAHNVYIGAMSVIVAQTGVAGSTRLGRFVILAGQAGLAGHLTIGDNVKVAAQSGLMRDVASGETVAGSPAMPVRDWHKQTIILQRLIRNKKDASKSPN